MKRLTVFVGIMLVGLLFMQGQARAEGAVQDLTGFWSLHFSSGGTGFLTLVKTGGDGRDKPSYTGKLKLEGMGEFPVFSNQAPDYFKPGNEIFFGIGDRSSTKFILFTATGSNTMPGRLTGTGWGEGVITAPFKGDVLANR
ncbi:MAG: hypothetical protein NT087_13415 [Deltaproteobacteria bacterium]|nr:hypothetical protein [Deltaproteobacteria bacterium]